MGQRYALLRLFVDIAGLSGESQAGSVRGKIGNMDGLWSPHMWGSPVGLAIFIFLIGIGMGVFFWGLSKLAGKK